MLLSAISLAYFLAAHVANAQTTCSQLGATPPRVTEESNYIIDYFNSALLFTYAMNKCTATGILPGQWFMYTCSKADGKWTVTKKKYTNAACTKGESVIGSYAEGDYTEGELGYFDCNGANNYVEVDISVYSDCSSAQTVYAGLGGCAHNTPLLTEFYCDSTQGLVELYIDPASLTTTAMPSNDTMLTTSQPMTTGEMPPPTCSSNFYCDKWTFLPACGPVAELMGVPIYGKLDACLVTSPSPETTSTSEPVPTTQSSASSLFVITNLAFALVVSLFSLF